MAQSIKRAVWSFWSKPFQTGRNSFWFSEKHHLLSWILSFERARKLYPETVLITDDDGVRMLIDGLGLEFATVTTELNALRKQDPDWWVSGKLYAYRSQTQPFVHLDNDVFLWKALPERLLSAPVLAQNPESFDFGNESAWYRPEVYKATVESTHGWLPEEFNWYVSGRGNQPMCCGIFGGNQVDFINYYADKAIQLVEHPQNQQALPLLQRKALDSFMVEQYFLMACISYHQNQQRSVYHDIYIECLFNSFEEAFRDAEKFGFTHLLGGAKRDPQLANKLERRVAQDYPEHYERCLRYLNEATSGLSKPSEKLEGLHL
jgi:hypothetical protein